MTTRRAQAAFDRVRRRMRRSTRHRRAPVRLVHALVFHVFAALTMLNVVLGVKFDDGTVAAEAAAALVLMERPSR
jgi:uncharacterized membrane protein